MLDLSCGDRG
jgi:hypothetical protein